MRSHPNLVILVIKYHKIWLQKRSPKSECLGWTSLQQQNALIFKATQLIVLINVDWRRHTEVKLTHSQFNDRVLSDVAINHRETKILLYILVADDCLNQLDLGLRNPDKRSTRVKNGLKRWAWSFFLDLVWIDFDCPLLLITCWDPLQVGWLFHQLFRITIYLQNWFVNCLVEGRICKVERKYFSLKGALLVKLTYQERTRRCRRRVVRLTKANYAIVKSLPCY